MARCAARRRLCMRPGVLLCGTKLHRAASLQEELADKEAVNDSLRDRLRSMRAALDARLKALQNDLQVCTCLVLPQGSISLSRTAVEEHPNRRHARGPFFPMPSWLHYGGGSETNGNNN